MKKNKLDIAKNLLSSGELVIFPTETVFGIGADATNDEAVKSIFKVKKISEPSEDFINTIMSKYEDFSSSTSLVKLNLILEKEINKEIRDNIKNLNI